MIVEAFESFSEKQLNDLGSSADPNSFLLFQKKDCLVLLGVSENGWWLGQKLASKEDIQSKTGKPGYFPSNFVIPLRNLREDEKKELGIGGTTEETQQEEGKIQNHQNSEKSQDEIKENRKMKETELEGRNYLAKRYGGEDKEDEEGDEGDEQKEENKKEEAFDWGNYARQNFLSKEKVAYSPLPPNFEFLFNDELFFIEFFLFIPLN